MASSLHGLLKRLVVSGTVLGALACPYHAHAVSPRELVEVVDIANLAMSPDGRKVAFRVQQSSIEQNTIDSAWYVQEIDGNAPAYRVADGGFAVHAYWGLAAPEPAVWSPDGRWIYYRAMIGGRVEVWRAASDGSGAVAMTQDPADVRDFSLNPDGRKLKYSVGATREQVGRAEQEEYGRGVLIDRSAPIGQPLFRSGYIDGRLGTQRYRDGHELDRVSLLADVADRWSVVDLATGQRGDLAPSDVPSRSTTASILPAGLPEPSDLAIDPQSSRIALLTSSGTGEGLYRKPHAELAVLLGEKTRGLLTCRAEPCRNKAITSVQWRPGSNEVVFTVTDPEEGLAQSIYRWDIETDSVHSILRSRGLINGGRDERSSCGVSAQALVCVAAEADRPPRLERIDLETGMRNVLFDPNAALASRLAVSVRLLRWKDAGGHVFTGQFFAPRRLDGHVPPLFVNYYQCSGFLRGGTGDEWPLASLVEQGIAVLCINYAPLRLDAVERYDQGLSAVESAIDMLAAAGEIDRRKVGMGGLSLGTEVTLWTVVNSDILAAASVSSTVPSPLAYQLRGMYDNPFYPGLRKYWQLGGVEETPERWRRLSLAFNLEKVSAPIMMQLPEQEYLLSIDWAVPLIKDHLAELYVFPDEAHFKFQPRHKLAVYERNLDWFRYWLLDKEDHDSAKKDQYARWRVMRSRVED